jgi:uncharacterized protein (TIGR02466 family)
MEARTLFATPLFEGEITQDFGITPERIEQQYKFCDDFRGQARTESMVVLEDFPSLRDAILEKFYEVKANYLGLPHIDFITSSSWFTRLKHGGTSNHHSHPNAVYSGVYYPVHGEYSPLGFHRIGLEDASWFLPPVYENAFNTSMVVVEPHFGKLVFFPSHVFHEVGQNCNDSIRYSLAFNLFPTGDIHAGDSSIRFKAEPLKSTHT